MDGRAFFSSGEGSTVFAPQVLSFSLASTFYLILKNDFLATRFMIWATAIHPMSQINWKYLILRSLQVSSKPNFLLGGGEVGKNNETEKSNQDDLMEVVIALLNAQESPSDQLEILRLFDGAPLFVLPLINSCVCVLTSPLLPKTRRRSDRFWELPLPRALVRIA